jgi:hypothetical protein
MKLAHLLPAAMLTAAPAFAGPISVGIEGQDGQISTVAVDDSRVILSDLATGVFHIDKLTVIAGEGCLNHCQTPGIFLSSQITNFASSGPGTLSLWITEQNLLTTVSPIETISLFTTFDILPGAIESVASAIMLDQSNGLYAGVPLKSAVLTDSGVSGPIFMQAPIIGSYSVTEHYIITADDLGHGSATINFDASHITTMDEPSSLLLLFAAAAAIGVMKAVPYRRSRAKA